MRYRSHTYFFVVSDSSQHLLLQALNDQNQATIDERLATEGVKDWINRRALPEQLDNPVRQFNDVKSMTCLAFASLVSEARTVQQLIEAGADVAVTDSKGFLPLHYACASDIDSDAKLVYLIQSNESSQNSTSNSNKVVLGPDVYSSSVRLAAAHNLAGRMKVLIANHGASVNDTDEEYRTALHIAAEAGHAEAVDVLVQNPDCRVNATNVLGRTALHLAAMAGHNEVVKVLALCPACRVNVTDRWEIRTALHHASQAGHAEAVKLLVQQSSCDFSITDIDGLTAARLTRRCELDDIAALIEAKYKGNFTKRFLASLHETFVVCSCCCCL